MDSESTLIMWSAKNKYVEKRWINLLTRSVRDFWVPWMKYTSGKCLSRLQVSCDGFSGLKTTIVWRNNRSQSKHIHSKRLCTIWCLVRTLINIWNTSQISDSLCDCLVTSRAKASQCSGSECSYCSSYCDWPTLSATCLRRRVSTNAVFDDAFLQRYIHFMWDNFIHMATHWTQCDLCQVKQDYSNKVNKIIAKPR